MVAPALTVTDLRVAYGSRARGTDPATDVVHGVSFSVLPGEVVALVGESGSGKSTTAHAAVGLLPGSGHVTGGQILLGGDALDLTTLPPRAWQRVRGARIGLVPQDPAVALNPVARIGDQVAEVLRIHRWATRSQAKARAVEILESVGLDNPAARARQYPHELSGGMRQRVLIGIALACEPELVIADEPTSALDVTVQRTVLDLLGELTSRIGTAVLLITHDLAVAADRADRVVVLKDGLIVEQGVTADVLGNPQHAYTRELLAAAPSLSDVRRRPVAGPVAAAAAPESGVLAAAVPRVPVLAVSGLTKVFRLPGGRGQDASITAVDDVSFEVHRGRTLALVGESGSGKSTTARLVLGLTSAAAGTVRFDGTDVTVSGGGRGRGGRVDAAALKELRRRTALVYQNPYASLEPRFSVGQIIDEPLRAHQIGSSAERRDRVAELIDLVRLPAGYIERRPEELSGGQRQRVAIARALALDPELVVLDEPTSALDVSVQAQILDLLAGLQDSHGLTYLFISHDLAVVRQVADDVAVMRGGRVVELGPTQQIFDHPVEEYTRSLLAAIPGSHRPTRTLEGVIA
ncbi:peptide/nickel transport system ATP-binding protein [Sanguibacter gelidistatuariae]|uniref:Peptide/nickel transport system ATP-binding protein n=1 Tax=Sanguibacter gelidistatuariae TaxID=1814289 RepID=A0A1G6HHW2_9MICO|nr:ABC transporter ATP-binding protein [Sanguibacter gelidistatuariae]SDB93036.1 peptide/nickel transport system ATP-binding protein [Sanguibacter gelidistatuariae]